MSTDNNNAVALAQEKLRKVMQKPVHKIQPTSQVKQFLQRTSQKGVLLADFSGSMRGEKHTKLVNALNLLIPKYPFFKVVAYGGDGEVAEVDITTMQSLEPIGSTPMKKAFLAGYDLDPTAIILVTDGEPTDASDKEIIDLAITKSIPVYTVGVKETAYAGGYNEEFLKTLATSTGGAFMAADSPIEIGAAIGGAMQAIEYKGDTTGKVVKL